jgi:hypothetical protein
MVLSTNFNNISVIMYILEVSFIGEETGVPGENY